MCFTGGFALGMMVDERDARPGAEPAVAADRPAREVEAGAAAAARRPGPGQGAGRRRRLRARPALHRRHPRRPAIASPACASELGDAFIGVEIDSSKGNQWGIPRMAHSVLTEHLVDEPGHPTRGGPRPGARLLPGQAAASTDRRGSTRPPGLGCPSQAVTPRVGVDARRVARSGPTRPVDAARCRSRARRRRAVRPTGRRRAEPELARPDLLEGLNPVQLEAVTHADGPLLVVAGAGSGKTRVLTHRIAHLIRDEGVSPFEILAITFTNKAADEMKQRVGRAGRAGRPEDVGVDVPLGLRAHPAARRQARSASRRRSRSTTRPTPCASPATSSATSTSTRKRFPPRSVHATISAAKNDGVDVEAYAAGPRSIFERKIADVYREYQARLRKAGAMDFDDLLGITVALFHEHPDVLEHYRSRFRHVLVDEYQDTNHVQNELVTPARRRAPQRLRRRRHRPVPAARHARSPRPTGPRRSSRSQVGDEVLGTAGGSADGRRHRSPRSMPGRYSGPIVPGARPAAATLRGTPHHIVPARIVARPGRWLVYLMYRADRGYRVGQTKSVRIEQRRQAAGSASSCGCTQEHADKLWVLRVCADSSEASLLGVVLRRELRAADGLLPRRRSRARDGRGEAGAAVPRRSTRPARPSS